MTRSLSDWLAWQERLHAKGIDLGLERVRQVTRRLDIEGIPRVITVGGTNGKGSSVALLEAVLEAAGHATGAYLSPHLLRYNERIRLGGREVSDGALCHAFERVEAARDGVPLTYFEFGTLAALRLFRDHDVQVALLEVGLGGRLDAVNILDPDCALITSVGIDHTEFLGPDRESIGFEKAGIFRPHRPAVCADPEPPDSLIRQAGFLETSLSILGRDFGYRRQAQDWHWWGGGRQWQGLPFPALGADDHQLRNAAGVVQVLSLLSSCLPVSRDALEQGLTRAWLPGRLQRIPGAVEWLLDVTHNPHGAQALAQALTRRPCGGRTLAVLGMLLDKDTDGLCRALQEVVHCWYPATLPGARGGSATRLAGILDRLGLPRGPACDSVALACGQAARDARPGDRILVLGSFYTVAAALEADLAALVRTA